MINLQQAFQKVSDAGEFLQFSKIEKPLHRRRDIAAFLLLDKLVPDGDTDIVEGASHDVVWLSINVEKLAEVATEADILYLYRCGIRLGEDTLEMFT
ncbi:MAG: hypothetical protein IM526_02345 [Microcystis sp. M38BS1]|uniref:hypothetical protein n=1 Tax=Microcystis sp. M38BS1 TaxID=2771188 RepID=UPI0031FBA475|nr:hypothetical protein [Microcystis sp. M38BS1]MCA6582494.1 hypothetical protein [Pseudanabaena sp. M34BS1SP1A06MG]